MRIKYLFAVVGLLATGANAGSRQTMSLDGTWQIVFDRQIEGRRGSWFQRSVFEARKPRSIRVPSCWEESEQDYEGVGWYARAFRVPAEWKSRHVRLRFGAVNYLSEIWLNGEPAGAHEGGYTPFDLAVGDLLKFDRENFLVVRVVGPAVTKDIGDILKRNEMPHWRGAIVGGIWQSVELVATNRTFVRGVFVEPKVDEEQAVVHASIEKTTAGREAAVVRFTMGNAGEQRKVDLAEGVTDVTAVLPVKEPLLWSPENPHLYSVSVDVGGNDLATRFGMREFTIRNGDFYLNGKRIFLKAGFWEGFYPSTLAYPRSLDIVRHEIRLAKEAGLNLLRQWRMPSWPATLDLADEMGILMVGSPPVECMGRWPEDTPELKSRWANEMTQLVLRDRNHPSVVMWETSNEILRYSLLRLRHEMSLVARRLDPTRLIIDESGGSRAPWGAHAYLPYASEAIPIFDRHMYLRNPLNTADYEKLATVGEPSQLSYVSEVGYGALADLPRAVARYEKEGNPITPDYRYHHALLASLEQCLRKNRLFDIFGSVSDFCRATQQIQASGNKLQLEALRINPKMDGYSLHAFTDGDWVLGAGVLDVWREPKKMWTALREVNQPLYLAIQAEPGNAYAEKPVHVKVTAVNESEPVDGDLNVEIRSEQGRTIWRTSRSVALRTGITTIFEETVKPIGSSGRHTIVARLGSAQNTLPILVLGGNDLKRPEGAVVLLDPQNQLGAFLPAGSFAADYEGHAPVMVTAADAYNEETRAKFVHLMDYVSRGGVAVFLRPPFDVAPKAPSEYDVPAEKNYLYKKPKPGSPNSLVRTGLVPFHASRKPSKGLWVGVSHYIRKHPIFDGLPSNCLMDQDYQSVCPLTTIVGLEGETVAGSISHDFIEDYRGPRNFWSGSDVVIVSHGKGKIIFSTLELIGNLGKDPVADKLFYNLVGFAQRLHQ